MGSKVSSLFFLRGDILVVFVRIRDDRGFKGTRNAGQHAAGVCRSVLLWRRVGTTRVVELGPWSSVYERIGKNNSNRDRMIKLEVIKSQVNFSCFSSLFFINTMFANYGS